MGLFFHSTNLRLYGLRPQINLCHGTASLSFHSSHLVCPDLCLASCVERWQPTAAQSIANERKAITQPPSQTASEPHSPPQGTANRPSTQDDKLEKSFRSCLCGGGEGTYLLFFRPLTPASLSPLLAGAHKGARRPPWLSSPEARVSGPRPTRQNTQYFSGSRLTPKQVTSNKFETVGSFCIGDEEKVNNLSVTWNCFSRDALVPQISMAFD